MLAVEDLAVRYGPIAALRGVSIAVDEGEFVGIVGPNGAGKSTLLFSITGAVKAETGSVSFCGETLSGLAPEDIVRRGMALVPEGRELFGELTVEENLRLGATIRRDRRGVEEVMREKMTAFPILRERRRARAEKLRAASSRCLRSPAPSWAGPGCCCSMSPRSASRHSSPGRSIRRSPASIERA